MPLVRRKRPLDREGGAIDTRNPKRLKTGKKQLCEFDRIGYTQDHYHSLHREFPEEHEELQRLISKEVGSFLNGKGGILCFGCRENGTVYGDAMNRKEEDNLKLLIDNVFKKFRPIVEPQKYRVTFTYLGGRYTTMTKKAVVEIRIQAGDQYEMYEDYNHETYLRKEATTYGPLTPHEIKRFTTQQLRQKLKAITPIQKVLLTPTKVTPDFTKALNTRKKLENRKGKIRIRLPCRHESSGSEEDPISVAVVKPIISMEAKCSSTTQQEREKREIVLHQPETRESITQGGLAKNSTPSSKVVIPATSFTGGKSLPVKPTVAPSLSHPLAQTVKSTARSAVKSTSSSTPSKHDMVTRSQNISTANNSKNTSTSSEAMKLVSTKPTAKSGSTIVTAKPALAKSNNTSTVSAAVKTVKPIPAKSNNCSYGSAATKAVSTNPASAKSSSTDSTASKTVTAKPTAVTSHSSSSGMVAAKTITSIPAKRNSSTSLAAMKMTSTKQVLANSHSNYTGSTTASKVVTIKTAPTVSQSNSTGTTASKTVAVKPAKSVAAPRKGVPVSRGNRMIPALHKANGYSKPKPLQYHPQQNVHHYLPPPPAPPQPFVPQPFVPQPFVPQYPYHHSTNPYAASYYQHHSVPQSHCSWAYTYPSNGR